MKKDFDLPLVNAHTHAAMIAFRGMAEDLLLKDWLEKYIWPMEKEKVNPKFVYENTKIAIKEMQRNGIRFFNDMYFFEDEVAKAAEELKMNVVVGEVILDFPTPSARCPEETLEITEKLLIKYKNNPYIKVAVAPHSIYALSEEYLVKAKVLAKKYDAIYHIHLAETKFEVEECQEKHNLTPVGYIDKLGLLDKKTVLIHCIWLNDNDIDILARNKANVVHCPLSNLKLGSGIAPVSKMIEKGINVALGTDGAASSNRLDIWEAGKFAALLQKGINNDPVKISAQKAIEMMTINGLKVLGIDIEKQLSLNDNYNFLYELNVDDLNFL
mgnify:CR=1 FL=1